MIQATALDSDHSALTTIDAFCQRSKRITLSRTFTQPHEALLYIQQHRVDLVFLEAQLSSGSGVDFWRTVQQWASKRQAALPQLVFATAHSEYAQISYELQAFDYLLKPFSYERFAQTVRKASEQVSQPSTRAEKPAHYRSFRLDYGLINVNLMDILYVEALGNYCKLYFDNQSPLLIRSTIKSLLLELAPLNFMQVHRSYLVAMPRISAIRNKQVYLSEKHVPLGTNYERSVHNQFEALMYSSQHSVNSSQSDNSLEHTRVLMKKHDKILSK